MKIAHVDIQNFRKLRNCRVVFSEQKTVFVGANNSGKTSAMDALILFLKNKCRDFTIRDFTLSIWRNINQIASGWLDDGNGGEPDMSQAIWYPYVPTLDVWLDVRDDEVHYVSHIIPTLGWTGGKLGVRLVFEPKDTEELYKTYKLAYESAKETSNARGGTIQLWPKSMRDFLEKDNLLQKHFAIMTYILDPARSEESTPQPLPAESEPLDVEPFKGLFKIDIINAQRGFSDPNSEDGGNGDRRLSSQLRGYFEKHLNPSELPEASDLDALEAMDKARVEFDKKLKESFSASIGELENLNYPGFSDPKILITSVVDPLQGIRHEAAVQFNVGPDGGESSHDVSLCLPEKYNGLGYQNLISMIFSLIRFRDEWMRVGKAGKRVEAGDSFIAPLHIVLVEEPEAHLHAQVQQVFIKKAYDVLRHHDDLKDNPAFSTQLVISTHSSHIAHEIDFVCLRYFKRKPAEDDHGVPSAEVVNLSTTFGDGSDTAKFASRYLKTTHCDLFFADAAILIEGPAERMLVPHFIRHHYAELNRCYVCLLEIGGSHAHQLRPLIEALGILTLVITDLDSLEHKPKDEAAGRDRASNEKVLPQKANGYLTGNDTIKSWVPETKDLDEALNATFEDKVIGGTVRAAYQYEMKLSYGGDEVLSIPYTFEDAIVLTNIEFFKSKTESKGLMKKMADAVNEPTIAAACQSMFDALSKNSKKAEMAMELLYTSDPSDLIPPLYIREGLAWLEENLVRHRVDYITPDGE
jgi:predicted ATP-dependent endonuclease of OLD family